MPTESAEVSLASNPDDPAATNRVDTLNASNWWAVTFAPEVPADATAVSFNSATLDLAKTTNVFTGNWEIRLYECDAAGKLSPVLLKDRVTLAASDIPMYITGQTLPPVTVTFGASAKNLPYTDHAKRYAVAVCPLANGPSGYIGSQTGGTQTPADMALVQSINAGSSWNAPVTTRDAIVDVKGTYTTP